ncbi:hypothetical protein [Exiguobacterium mexicanum]|uniref:hypothetical protein n=1 Tax=Exiguobacterium mexicanum TaxID=340146 RepID=UPI00110D2EF4|nr:hypothetical protein [Exiguobacterium mexicanum]
MFDYLASNWIGLLALIIAFVTLIYTWKSAKSAKKSELTSEISSKAAVNAADASFKQVELMQKEINNSHLPKILPLKGQATFAMYSLSDIKRRLLLYETENKPTDVKLSIQVSNSGIGNAYNVCTYLEINNEALDNLKNLKTPQFYKTRFNEDYTISYNEQYDRVPASIQFNLFSRSEENIFTFPLIQDNNSKSLLIQNEIHEMRPKSFMYLIIFDLIYRDIHDHWIYSNPELNGLELVIKFQTNDQIDTDDFSIKRYKLKMERVFSSHERGIMTLFFDFKYMRDF